MKNKIVILLLLLSSFAMKAQIPIPIEEGGNNTRYYYDGDRDGYGDPNAPYVTSPQSGYVTNNRDCNDRDRNIYPGAVEICDGKDNNCNNQIDEIPKPLTPLIVTVSNQCGKSVLSRGVVPSGVTWYWQSSSSGTSRNSSSSSITRTSGSVYYLRARNNSTGCWSSSRSASYSIKSVPSIPNVPTVVNNCGSSKLTKGSSPSGVTWYWQSSSSGTSTSNTSASITRTGGSSYYLRARNNSTGCWSSVRTVSYSIKSVPSIPSIPTVVNNCGSSKLTKGSSPSGITWYWQSSSSGTSTSNSSASITRTSGSSYYLRARNNSTGCWSSVRTVSYSIKLVPSIPSVPTVANNCGNSKLTKGSSPSGVTWYWQSSLSGTSTSNSSASITRTSGSSYYLRARNNSTGCWSSVRSVSYSIKSIPSIPSVPTVVNNCGSSKLTKGSSPSGVTWYWQSSSSGTSTSNSSVSITRTSGSSYYLRARNNSTGCWSSSRSVSYSIKSLPNIPSVPTIVNNCGSSKLTKGNSPSGVTWYWQSSTSGTSTSNTSASITRTSGSSYYLRARNNSTGCWSSVRTVSYSIKSVPSRPSVPTVVNNCGSSKLTKGSSPSGVTWYWQSSSSGTSRSNSSASITRTSGSSYYLRARNNSTGCWGSSRSVNYTIKTASTWYADTDSDGYGNSASTKSDCTQPVGFVTNSSDYDDATNKITNIAPQRFYLDADNDGFGDPNNSVYYSVRPAGYVTNNTDNCPTQAGVNNGCEYLEPVFSNENYVFTRIYKKGMTSPSSITSNKDVSESITYFDGLGRTKQSIAIQAGGHSINNKATIDWTLNNTGSTGFFNQNGATTENKIINGTTPFGDQDLLWECKPDATSNADGGWNSDYFDIDNTKSYRYTIWVKKNKIGSTPQGRTYHGIQYVNNLNGTVNVNPYFVNFLLPKANTWYLMVGIVHPHDYTGPDTGESGVYDKEGNKILDGTEFKWSTSYTTTRLRDYLYYTTDTSVRQYFWSPLFQQINGRELTLREVLKSPSKVSATSPPKDIVTHFEYDELGRQTKEYLPYATTSNGLYKEGDIALETKEFYKNKYTEDFAGVPLPNVNAYSEKQFDNSPLNRVQKQAAPGDTWKLGNGHEIKFEYQANVLNEVKIFEVTTVFANGTYTPSLIGGSSYYDVDELYKTVTKDENWIAGLNHTTEEFKNKDGQVILKRTYNENQKHDTYYVYDDFGNLTYVLPPKIDASEAASTLAVIQTKLNDLGYQYKYDHRNRLVEKKIPGKDWEYIIYDKLDRPVLTQDANLKTQKKWLFTKYDILGRVVYTGIYTHATVINRQTMQTYFNNQNLQNTVNAASKMYEEQLTVPGALEMYYSNANFPNTNSEVLTVNYYDNYVFYKLRASENSYGIPFTNRVKGLVTGSRVKVLETNSWITTITYYDEKARPIYVFSINDLLSTIDILESKLDAFTGKVLETKTTHKKAEKADIITVDHFEYDHTDRLINQTQKINNQEEQVLVENIYDELGQLKNKGVGGKTTQNRLQIVDYKYNVRGWLKNINEDGLNDKDLFNFTINYNNPTSTGTGLFNGNISQTSWNTLSADKSAKMYNYRYDALNRITGATEVLGDKYDVSGIRYDKNGNIRNLIRRGHLDNTTTPLFGEMDNLVYDYGTANGNKLLKVTDTGVAPIGVKGQFQDKNKVGNDYAYDLNGNMTSDKNKEITNITYNHLNLPTRVTIDGKNIDYTYDATGTKLKKVVNDKTTDYAGNYIYKNNMLQFLNHPEGYVSPVNTSDISQGFKYVYQYKDHLGNVRLSYTDNNNDGVIQTDGTNSEIVEESNYYPFGLKHKGYNNVRNIGIGNPTAQKFGFGGKELNDDLVGGSNLNWHDFGARNYDAALGRWMNLDPLAEDMYTQSPYVYALNNPILMVDPDGKKPFPGPFTGRAYRQKNGIIITVARITSEQRYATGVYTQVAYAGTGWLGVGGATIDAIVNPPTGNSAANTANALTPTGTAAAAELFDGFVKGYYQGQALPGKYDVGHLRGVTNVFFKGPIKALGYVGLALAVSDNNTRANEYLEKATYDFGDAMISGSNINIVNEGLFDVNDETSTEENVESRLNVIHTGVSLALKKYDLNTKKGRNEANKFLGDKQNRRLIMHFINALWGKHKKESE